MKQCSSCKQALPVERFHRNSQGKDGLDHRCKECTAKRCSARRKALKPHREPDASRELARHMARDALRKGLLVREPCFMCGAHAEMHHPSYSAPLLVTWLCREHHRQLHRDMPSAARAVLAVNPATGERKVLRSMSAGLEHGFQPKPISLVCNGHQKSHRGWVFSFAAAPKTGGANG